MSTNTKTTRISLAFITILVCSKGTLLAQAISGTVVGTVHDSSGAVIAKAGVTATKLDTGLARSTVANDEGDYTLPNLAPGT
jgi:hypothetical protein